MSILSNLGRSFPAFQAPEAQHRQAVLFLSLAAQNPLGKILLTLATLSMYDSVCSVSKCFGFN